MNTNGSWIKLYRSSLDHWLFTEYRPLTRQEAWIRILLTVNYDYSKSLIKGQIYECKPGQSLLSLESWARNFVWSVQQVRTFFKLLEADGMVKTEGLQYTTRLTVCNWDSYQSIATGEEQTDNKPLTDGQQAANKPLTTTKESKEYKERKEYKKSLLSEIEISDFPEINNDYFEIAKSFQLLFKNNLIEAGTATTLIDKANGKWIDDVRLMIESDKYTMDDLRAVYLFLQKDAFWKQNILSISKLREKMPQLKLKIYNGNGNGNSRTNNKEATSWGELAQIVADSFANRS
jgi:hypothetical protein